ncbi:hypothetical protein C4E22_03130 [ANME-1 cluster archaeon AG-394-G06]|nr:hypothetical protein [ANME-1 cluster archaeon AG-394-G06]
MSEKKEEKIVSAGKLDWKKGNDYKDKFSEVMTVILGGRSVILDFGALEEEGKKGGENGIESVDPYIEHHTRIRVSLEHFEAIVNLLNEQLERIKEERR